MSSRANPFLPTTARRRPLVVGHRGVPLLHQENSLAGFRRAVALGIPAVELDVRLTADGRAVVFHDRDVARLTDGHGEVCDLTWDELARLRLRRVLPMGVAADGTTVEVTYARSEPIALLAEVLAELAGKVAINVELKIGLPRWWDVAMAAVAARDIAAADATADVIVTSFDPRKLRRARQVHPGLVTGFAWDDTMLDGAAPLLDRLGPRLAPGARGRGLLTRAIGGDLAGRVLGTQAVGADHTLVHGDVVTRLHRAGVGIGTHTLFPLGSTTGKRLAPTASSDGEVARLIELGVDWIESDDPERLLALVDRAPAATSG
ncbi:MAG: glycerophosphodiester phosphodiesterase [Kofleriaceae bacterium]